MNDRNRLAQLHVLLDRLGQLPASEERDRMLREVRARAVDVDTGVRPAPMRPYVREPAVAVAVAPAAVVKPQRPAVCRQAVRVAAPPRPVPALRRPSGAALVVVGAEAADHLEIGGVLWLDDLPGAPDDAAAASPAPWARGLRG
jgi:hypothetical protein